MQHRYSVGQMLEMRSAPRHSNRPAGVCEVVSCLPHEKGPLLYRVRSLGENNDRVVEEIDLTPSSQEIVPGQEDADRIPSVAIGKR
jgi:hypothetical protein